MRCKGWQWALAIGLVLALLVARVVVAVHRHDAWWTIPVFFLIYAHVGYTLWRVFDSKRRKEAMAQIAAESERLRREIRAIRGQHGPVP